jgi:hypothetical protein
MLIGPPTERWHIRSVVKYPSVAASVELIHNPVYSQAVRRQQVDPARAAQRVRAPGTGR